VDGRDGPRITAVARRETLHSSTIESLPEVLKAWREIFQSMVEAAVRRGTDMLKPLALGATAFMDRRPQRVGTAAFGQPALEAVSNPAPRIAYHQAPGGNTSGTDYANYIVGRLS